jgi:hypothetical protein
MDRMRVFDPTVGRWWDYTDPLGGLPTDKGEFTGHVRNAVFAWLKAADVEVIATHQDAGAVPMYTVFYRARVR